MPGDDRSIFHDTSYTRYFVNQLADYPWSSYPAYINQRKVPEWLESESTYLMLGSKQRYRGYADYVDAGIDADIAQYYNRGNLASVLGGKDFKSFIYEEVLPGLKAADKAKVVRSEITIAEIEGLQNRRTKPQAGGERSYQRQ